MEQQPKNLSTPEEVKENEKTTLKRKIALVIGRFNQVYAHGGASDVYNFKKQEKLNQFHDNLNIDYRNGDIGSNLQKNIESLLKEQGINTEDLKIEITAGSPNTYGSEPNVLAVDTIDVKIFNKNGDELIYDSSLEDPLNKWEV